MPKIRLIAQKKDAQNTQNNGQKGMFFLILDKVDQNEFWNYKFKRTNIHIFTQPRTHVHTYTIKQNFYTTQTQQNALHKYKNFPTLNKVNFIFKTKL